MNKSESIIKLAAALVKFHGAMGKVSKDSTNPHFKNKYASLSTIIEAVTPNLNANGLAVIQHPTVDGLETVLLHESGEYISSLSAIVTPPNANAQQVGSAITYSRRYALGAILSLNIDEDDDANAASAKPAPRPAAPAPAPKAKPELTPEHKRWGEAVASLAAGKTTIAKMKDNWIITDAVATQLAEEAANFKA